MASPWTSQTDAHRDFSEATPRVNQLFAMSSFALVPLRPPSRPPSNSGPAQAADHTVGSIHARYVTLLFALLNGTQQVPAHDGYASITGGAFLDTALTSSHPLCRAYRFA